MKTATLTTLSLALISCLLIGSSIACDPTAAEMAVRMRMQAFLNMYPNIYEDIRQGRLAPNRGNYNQGNYVQPGQQGNYIPNQQGNYVQPGQQGTYIPNQQGTNIQPGQGTYIPAQNTGRWLYLRQTNKSKNELDNFY